MNDIVVSLVTFYKNTNIRRNLAIKTIQQLINNQILVIVIDGGSDKEFLDIIINLGAQVNIQTNKDLRESKREAYQRAYDTKKEIIICMEPEKVDFIKSIPFLVSKLKENNLDIVYPGRKSLESYPKFQSHTEQAANLFFGDFLNLYWDFYFGPVIWKRECSNYFLNFKEKIPSAQWDISIIAPLIAKKEGKKVEQIKIDFTYEPEMKSEEEGSLILNQKRINQLNSLTQTIIQYPELRF